MSIGLLGERSHKNDFFLSFNSAKHERIILARNLARNINFSQNQSSLHRFTLYTALLSSPLVTRANHWAKGLLHHRHTYTKTRHTRRRAHWAIRGTFPTRSGSALTRRSQVSTAGTGRTLGSGTSSRGRGDCRVQREGNTKMASKKNSYFFFRPTDRRKTDGLSRTLSSPKPLSKQSTAERGSSGNASKTGEVAQTAASLFLLWNGKLLAHLVHSSSGIPLT